MLRLSLVAIGYDPKADHHDPVQAVTCSKYWRHIQSQYQDHHGCTIRGTHGVIVVYDVTSAESFVNVKRWLHEINQNCDDVCRILVGNKNDDPGSKVVETNDAQKFAEQMGIRLFETSAKENVNVEDVGLD
ncbi:ras-related protein Rab-35-like [Xyrauchen texanus]|uniref:ras-related protein Rab-35-like n=1 Tax=Xyrauchen texanus TaxID=154827 RepID=UPI0022425B4D|nr:ras-related protein Rab-35-like [Xyrauchen texanus]